MSYCEKTAVKQFWEKHPLLSFELDVSNLSEFFKKLNHAKTTDSDKFAIPFWEFDGHKNEKVLDVGCGPGWLTVNYAMNGACVHSIDLTQRAVELTRRHMELHGLDAYVQVGDAEALPYLDDSFDFAVSSGVLHHTPNTQKAIDEIYRVLKPGKRCIITLYYRNILLRNGLFPITRWLFNAIGMNVPGRSKFNTVKNREEFVRIYDGNDNPVGKAYSIAECKNMFKNFRIISYEVHFFPKRFLPFGKIIPDFFHKLLDRYCGTMVYFNLEKKY